MCSLYLLVILATRRYTFNLRIIPRLILSLNMSEYVQYIIYKLLVLQNKKILN